MHRVTILGLLLMSLAGCFLRAEEPARTYPEAQELEFVSLADLQFSVAAPDSFNVDVFVVNWLECPPDHACYVADHVVVSETRVPESQNEQLWIGAYKPSQFRIGSRYVMSLSVRDGPGVDHATGEPTRHIRLLGYTRVR